MEDFKQEIREMKDKINEIEYKYLFIQDYNMIAKLLDKLNIEEFELSKEEIENNNAVYIVERTEDKVKIKKANTLI